MKRLQSPDDNERTHPFFHKLFGNNPTIPLFICALGVARMIGTDPFFLSVAVVATILATCLPKLVKKHYRQAFVACLMLCTTALMLGVNQSANAQFFQSAESYFTSNFSASSAGITVVFAALRALYIIYVAVSLIGAINAFRSDEDWMTVARTPTLVVVGVTLADFLTTMITG